MKLKHVVSAKEFDTASLQSIFQIASDIKAGKYNKKTLEGKIMATLFYEPSTRTRMSFESAMLRLGGAVISTENAAEFSSAIKGETIEDTIRIVNGYCDVIVIRHYEVGAAKKAADFSQVPVINGGDGSGEHPTQALLDLFTIFSKFKDKNITVAMMGDLLNGRTIHSLSRLLALYPSIRQVFISPKELSIPKDLKIELQKKNIKFTEVESITPAVAQADVIYQTRIQKERFKSEKEYQKYYGKYVIDKNTLKLIKKSAVVMHPLPRVNEITAEVDNDPRAIYFEEAKNGVFIRMALLLSVFDKAKRQNR